MSLFHQRSGLSGRDNLELAKNYSFGYSLIPKIIPENTVCFTDRTDRTIQHETINCFRRRTQRLAAKNDSQGTHDKNTS